MRRLLSCCVWFAVALSGCEKDKDLAGPDQEQPDFVRLLELTFRDIGTPNMHTSVLVARDVPDLERVRALGVGDSLIRFHLVATGVLDMKAADAERRRLVHAIFQVDNLVDATVSGDDILLVGVAASDTPVNGEVRPAGIARFDENGAVTVDSVNVLRVLTAEKTASFVRPRGIAHVFDYGFVVRPSGLVTFAFSLPLSHTAQDDIRTLTVLLMAVRIPN